MSKRGKNNTIDNIKISISNTQNPSMSNKLSQLNIKLDVSKPHSKPPPPTDPGLIITYKITIEPHRIKVIKN